MAFLNFIGLNPLQVESLKGDTSEQRDKLFSVDDRPVRGWFSKARVSNEGEARNLSGRLLKLQHEASESEERPHRRSLHDGETLKSEFLGKDGSITVR
mmetsp:Transcript_31208/g.70237  ORF Transcript_31208/g.70237 Transcript_31208/m.70237 type:complete len:98 (+) Transcript_31208:1329-1622(+)